MLFLFTTVFITKSSGRVTSFSSTYFIITSKKGLPYRIDFPLLTPLIFSSSSIDVGYIVAMSSIELSRKITNGGRFFSLATFFLTSLSNSSSFSSVVPEAAPAASPASSSALASSNKLFKIILKELGFFKNACPLFVIFNTPYSTISFSSKPCSSICLIRLFHKCGSLSLPQANTSSASCRYICTCGVALPIRISSTYSIANCSPRAFTVFNTHNASSFASTFSLGLRQLSQWPQLFLSSYSSPK